LLELFERKKISKPIRLIELFAGYGSQALALKRLGVDFEHYQVVEFDKYAIETYNALHGTKMQPKDITKVETLNILKTKKYDYIMTYSFPCTDLSLAGKGEGIKKGTRSGLLWEVERLLSSSKELPQILIMENVPMIHSKKHNKEFQEWIRYLENLGYSNHWEDLNAKDYGIPQNRNRTFMVSLLGDYEFRFPVKKELKSKITDFLDDDVEETLFVETDYYLKGKDYIVVPEATKRGFKEAYVGDGIYLNRPHQKRGVVQKGMIQTLTTNYSDFAVVLKNLKVRKLTPREYFRVMGLKDKEIDKIINLHSKTQLYKQAGNSIVVNVLEEIFKELL